MPDIFDSSVFSSFFGGASSVKKTAPKVSPKKPNNGGSSVSFSAPDSKIGKIFGARVITLDPNLCFVLMPFKSEMKPIYEDHIKPSVEKAGLTCLRADEIVGTNMITVDIWESINRARFIVADLTGQNPNVFYELGLAHAIGKDVVLITQTTKDVPFDLKLLRCIVYSYDPRGVKDLEAKLIETIKAIIAKG